MFSVLSGLTMLTAMVCDLLLTPASLVLLGRLGARGARGVVAGLGVLMLTSATARASEVVVPPALAPALADAGEKRWGRTFVPDEVRKVGEVRLLTRGDADVVETVLYTPLLRRVVREIRQKEMKNWPDGAAGHEDAVRYVDALERAERTLSARLGGEGSDDRVRRLLIEFVLTPTQAAVVLSRFESQGEGDDVRVVAHEPLAVLELSRDYVRRNMRLIAADSFAVDGESLDRLVSPLRLLR
jgi:hypothetical protein